MTIWFVAQAEESPAALQALLQQLTAQTWTVVSILTNGINHWTVVCSKEA